MSKFDEHLFGRIAVLGGYISREQLDECLEIQRRRDRPTYIGQVLLDQGYLSTEQVEHILTIRRQKVRKLNLTRTDASKRDREFARLALQAKLVDLDQLEDTVLEQQQLRGLNLHFTLGEVFLSRGEIEMKDVLRVVGLQGRRMLCCSVCDCHYRVQDFREGEEYTCRKCASVLVSSRLLDDQLADGVLEASEGDSTQGVTTATAEGPRGDGSNDKA